MTLDNRKWILIVEDNADFQYAMSNMLRANGFGVLACRSPSDALRMISNQKFDCILLDMQLESGTGEKVISSLKENKRGLNQKTPILVISGGLDADLVKRVRTHVAGMLVKPFDCTGFIARVRNLSQQASCGLRG